MMRKIHGSVAKLVNDILPERHKPFWAEKRNKGWCISTGAFGMKLNVVAPTDILSCKAFATVYARTGETILIRESTSNWNEGCDAPWNCKYFSKASRTKGIRNARNHKRTCR